MLMTCKYEAFNFCIFLLYDFCERIIPFYRDGKSTFLILRSIDLRDSSSSNWRIDCLNSTQIKHGDIEG